MAAVVRGVLPHPARSLEDWRRFAHEDLLELSRRQLGWEAARIGHALASYRRPDDEAPPWLLERLRLLRAELRRRTG